MSIGLHSGVGELVGSALHEHELLRRGRIRNGCKNLNQIFLDCVLRTPEHADQTHLGLLVEIKGAVTCSKEVWAKREG